MISLGVNISVSINICINDIKFFLLSREQGIFVVTNFFLKINSTSENSSFFALFIYLSFLAICNDYNKSFQNNLADFKSYKENTSIIW